MSIFPAIRFILLVGIGSGISRSNADIRLGDIVVGYQAVGSGRVIQYDLEESRITGLLNPPPKVLLTALLISKQGPSGK